MAEAGINDRGSIEVRVLIADGEARRRQVVSSVLQAAGYMVVVMDDGQDAMDLFDDQIAVAFVDASLPTAGGFDCLRFAGENFPATQVIMLSASCDIPDAVDAMKQGACDYLTTPLDEQEIIMAVEEAVRLNRVARRGRFDSSPVS